MLKIKFDLEDLFYASLKYGIEIEKTYSTNVIANYLFCHQLEILNNQFDNYINVFHNKVLHSILDCSTVYADNSQILFCIHVQGGGPILLYNQQNKEGTILIQEEEIFVHVDGFKVNTLTNDPSNCIDFKNSVTSFYEKKSDAIINLLYSSITNIREDLYTLTKSL